MVVDEDWAPDASPRFFTPKKEVSALMWTRMIMNPAGDAGSRPGSEGCRSQSGWEVPLRLVGILALAGILLLGDAAPGEIRSADLNATRMVMDGEWLRLKLEVLGLRLSYPAYRISLKLNEDNTIVFDFLASGGMADHLADMGRSEAGSALAYHAEGIRDQVSRLIQNEFPTLWPAFDPGEDFHGQFLVPDEDWNEPPRQLAHWKGDRFYWNP